MKDYFYSAVKGFIEAGFAIWNACMSAVLSLLTQTPEEFANGSLWGTVKSLEPIFVGVGSSLIVIFFVIGFCSESVDIKSEMRLEVILRILIRLGLSEALVVYNLSIVKTIFQCIANLAKLVFGVMDTTGDTTLSIPDKQIKILKDLGAFGLLPLILIAFIVLLVIASAGFMMLYTVYYRVFKVLIIIPYGSLAFSTMAGNSRISHTSSSFVKYAITTGLEAVTIILALFLGMKFVNSGILPEFVAGSTDKMLLFTIWCLQTCFTTLLTVGIVKGSQSLTSKALGLPG
ncbi:MAG TPA: hypothetical protein VHQ24_03630 [Lachnospiraceae bacterium]|nr:hypothetical protein [Lachnospiraceae bacterium]